MTTKVIMPKSKPSMSVSTGDNASSLNGSIAEKRPTPPTRKIAYSPGPNGEQTMNVAAGRLPEDVYTTRCRRGERRYGGSASR